MVRLHSKSAPGAYGTVGTAHHAGCTANKAQPVSELYLCKHTATGLNEAWKYRVPALGPLYDGVRPVSRGTASPGQCISGSTRGTVWSDGRTQIEDGRGDNCSSALLVNELCRAILNVREERENDYSSSNIAV